MPPPPPALDQPRLQATLPGTPTTTAAGSTLEASLPVQLQQPQVEPEAQPLSAMQRLLHD